MNKITIDLNDYDYERLMDFVRDFDADLQEFVRSAIHEKVETEREKRRVKIPSQRMLNESSFDQQESLEELRF